MERSRITIGVLLFCLSTLCACSDSSTESYEPFITNVHAQSQMTTEPSYVFPEVPGITYRCVNENLQKYLYITKDSQSQYYVFGQAVHLGNIQHSMDINDIFTLTSDSTFDTSDNKLTLVVKDKTIQLTDHRQGPIMPMSGTYVLCEPRKAVLSDKSTEASENSIEDKVTIYDAPPLYDESAEVPSNVTYIEQETYNIHAQFVKNIECNGMEFITQDNHVIYVFGGQMNNPNEWMTLELIYRGCNPKYNGYVFPGTAEHCFNLVRRID